ncbi:hypothetical protein KSP39_PZI022662 [Platanthera zijinensis]|uniref:Uncharacterized protein n=1 Tax=Platanthera zijinensis TaxID=2320716 RepID=A0AAP0AVN4_9ASPA
MSTIQVRFLIDREQRRVVFAQAGSDFVDLLFSFLILPLGRIARLLSKRSGLGSLSSLYESVERLDAKYLQTEACRDMLLNPWSAAAELCEALKIKGIHELNPREFYTCSQEDCLIQSICYYTYSSKCLCSRCGKLMDRAQQWKKSITDDGGVFLTHTTDFIITDDLQITLPSFREGLSLFKQLQIKDSSVLEEQIIEFSTKKALKLLGRSFVSKNALTEVCFPDFCVQTSGDFSLSCKEDIVADEAKNDQINLELILNKNDNKVLYAEVGDDFVNQLFSFLTFPLGSALKFLSNTTFSLGGCIQNLYSSVESMSLDYFRLEICRNMLLTPVLPTFYRIKNQILKLEEMKSTTLKNFSCAKCFSDNRSKSCASTKCIHGITETEYIEQNPKLSAKSFGANDGGFVVSARRFMVTDNLHISPLSLISAACKETNLPISDLIRREVCLDRTRVLSLLTAMLTSKATLTDVFSPKPKPQRRSQNNYA